MSMPGRIVPLQYAIDNWHQLPGARSNTDPTMRIKVTDFVHSDILEGLRIQVHHPQYGILFSCLVNTSGRLTSWDQSAFLTTPQILIALRQLGFIISFKERPILNSETRRFLESCLITGYTHIRWAVCEKRSQQVAYTSEGNDFRRINSKIKERVIVCFNEDKRPELLEQCIKPIKEFKGDVMRISPNENKRLDFSWLSMDIPVHIEDILKESN